MILIVVTVTLEVDEEHCITMNVLGLTVWLSTVYTTFLFMEKHGFFLGRVKLIRT